MKYEKPTISLLSSAGQAIQCEAKESPQSDCEIGKHSTPAYEADE